MVQIRSIGDGSFLQVVLRPSVPKVELQASVKAMFAGYRYYGVGIRDPILLATIQHDKSV